MSFHLFLFSAVSELKSQSACWRVYCKIPLKTTETKNGHRAPGCHYSEQCCCCSSITLIFLSFCFRRTQKSMCTARSHLHNSEGKHFLFMLVSQHNMVARRTESLFFYFYFFCLFYFTVGRERLLSWGNSEDARLVSDGHTSKRPSCAINRSKSWKTGCQKPSRGKDNGQSLHDSVIISLTAMIRSD